MGKSKSFATPEEATHAIDNIIKNGDKIFENGDKAVFRIGHKLVTVRKNFRERGKKIADKNWVLTAYDEMAADGDISAITGANKAQAARGTAKSEGKVNDFAEDKQWEGQKSSVQAPDEAERAEITELREEKAKVEALKAEAEAELQKAQQDADKVLAKVLKLLSLPKDATFEDIKNAYDKITDEGTKKKLIKLDEQYGKAQSLIRERSEKLKQYETSLKEAERVLSMTPEEREHETLVTELGDAIDYHTGDYLNDVETYHDDRFDALSNEQLKELKNGLDREFEDAEDVKREDVLDYVERYLDKAGIEDVRQSKEFAVKKREYQRALEREQAALERYSEASKAYQEGGNKWAESEGIDLKKEYTQDEMKAIVDRYDNSEEGARLKKALDEAREAHKQAGRESGIWNLVKAYKNLSYADVERQWNEWEKSASERKEEADEIDFSFGDGVGDVTEEQRRLGEALMDIARDADIEVITDEKEREKALGETANPMQRQHETQEISQRFDKELQRQIDGTLTDGHIYQLGRPGAILLSTGIPDLPIELSAQRLIDKATKFDHDFDLAEVKGLVTSLQDPVAVFVYGDGNKSQNIIVEISHNGKNFVVGMFMTPTVKGRKLEINSIRNIFPKDNAEWINWVQEGKLLYVNKNKIQPILNQLQTNPADVAKIKLDLNYAAKIINNFKNPKISSAIVGKEVPGGKGVVNMRTSKGEVYGFVKDGKIYIDPKLINPNTPIHEYTHLWDRAVQKANPKLWARGKELMKELSLWGEVKNDPAYADIAHDEDLIASEVHSRLSGKDGAKLLDRMVEEARKKGDYVDQAKAISLKDRIRRWLGDMLSWVRDAFSGKWGKKELDSLTVEEFAAMPIRDLAKGVNPKEKARKVNRTKDQNASAGENGDEAHLQMMIVGEKGASALDRKNEATHRMDNLGVAREMETKLKEMEGSDEHKRMVEAAKQVRELKPIAVKKVPSDKEDAHQQYKQIGKVTNRNTGIEVEFYNSAFKKNHREGGLFEKSIPALKDAFEKAVLAYREDDNLGGIKRKDGTAHKTHKNIEAFDNYIGKVKFNEREYYVRFTVQSLRSGETGAHSMFVSNVDIYENPTDDRTIPITSRGTTDLNGIVDAKLRNFFVLASGNKVDFARRLRYATGWERGADGKWRYEIPDGELIGNPVEDMLGGRRRWTLKEVWKDAELLAAYPELSDMEVEFGFDPKGGSNGEYSAKDKRIRITVNADTAMDADKANSVVRELMVHELQHAVQHIEGFARGSNIEEARQYIKDKRDKAVEAIETDLNERMEAARPAWDEVKRINSLEWTDENRDELEAQLARAEAEATRHDEIVARWRKFLDAANRRAWSEISDEEALEVYQQVAGEVEARNASRRMNMSSEERRSKLLEDTEDVGREDQIFLSGAYGDKNAEGNTVSEPRRRKYGQSPSLFGDELMKDEDTKQKSLFDSVEADAKAADTAKQTEIEKDIRPKAPEYREMTSLEKAERTSEIETEHRDVMLDIEDGGHSEKSLVDGLKQLSDLWEQMIWMHGEKPSSVRSEQILGAIERDILSIRKELFEKAKAETPEMDVYVDGDGTAVRYESMIKEKSLLGRILLDKEAPKLEEGEFCNVERIFRLNEDFNYTGRDEIKSADDVAYIFRQLENKSVENVFAVFVKDGKPVALHLSIGGYAGATVEIGPIKTAYEKLKPEKVYIVHNHPSGALKASPEDIRLFGKINSSLGTNVEGIIIDRVSGQYGLVDENMRESVREKGIEEGDAHVEVYSFDTQDFAPNAVVSDVITAPEQVASFISTQRLGSRAKMSMLVISRGGRVEANLHLPFENIDQSNIKELADRIAVGVNTFGGTACILYGDFDTGMRYEMFRKLHGELQHSSVRLNDALRVWGQHHFESIENNGDISEKRSKTRGGGTVAEPDVQYEYSADSEKIDSMEADIKSDGPLYRLGESAETFDARRKEAIANKGTVMPDLANKEVKVVEIPRHNYQGTIKEATKEAISVAKEKFAPNGKARTITYDNFGAKFEYSISGNAIEESLNPSITSKSANKGVQLAVAEHLDKVIGESIEVEEHPDYKKVDGRRGDEDVINSNALMHRFYGAIRVDGKEYRVLTLMREDKRHGEGNGIHAYEVQKIKVLDDEAPSTLNGVGTPKKKLQAYPLAKLLNDVVKSYDKSKKILEESKKIDLESAEAKRGHVERMSEKFHTQVPPRHGVFMCCNCIGVPCRLPLRR